MKLFYKKDYYKLLDLYETVCNNYQDALIQLDNQEGFRKELADLVLATRKKLKEVNGEKGGLTKENNKLRSELKEYKNKVADLEEKLKESMTDKYLIRKVKPGRPPKTQVVKISRPMSNNVRRFMKENFDN